MNSSPESAPEMPFIRLRAALELFGKAPFELDPQQAEKARRQAAREYEVESLILKAPEAAGVVAVEEEVERAYAEIAGRYQDAAAFEAALGANGLDPASLRQALARQCRVNTVLERVTAGADEAEIGDTEVGIYYHSHFDSFQQPERREAFHILISINDDFPENTKPKALERIAKLAARLAQKPKLFEELAQRHSECPTAMRGGRIGLVRRGQLFAPVEAALFALEAGQISTPVESEMGFHLVLCKSIQKPETISLKKATPHILKVLREGMRETRRREWIASLSPESFS
ncbi:MAG: nitrogen fixation protein NifM [Methylococcaceae bacterium]|nr:nitrogen fixation protein NifM [Methylococcaceae bacterium]